MIDEQPTKRPRSFWKELPILVVVAVVVAVVVRAFVVQTFWIPSESMQNTLQINDHVLVNKLVYDFRSPHRGEIIVFTAPQSWRGDPSEDDFIKRVIGVGGDHIVCCDADHRLVVNGYPLVEPYLYAGRDGKADLPSAQSFDITVPANRLWVMGDHRSDSGDSRENYFRFDRDIDASTIPVTAVVGRAFVIFWPFGNASWLTVPREFDKVPDPAGKK